MRTIKEIYELSAGVEYHLKQLENFVPVLREVKQSLDALKQSREGELLWEIHLVKQQVEELKNHLRRYGLQEASKYETELKAIREELESDRWPVAVAPEMICTSDEQAQQRAESILNMVVAENVQNRTFLDFGCGAGHVAALAKKMGAKVVGYDINLSQCQFTDSIFTSDFETVRKNGRYEIILLHDVLDHIEVIDPISALHQIKNLMDTESRVYIRNHPWCSRHGGHIYEQTNKAFAHLVFDDVELTRICGCQPTYNIKVSRPLETYRHWFATVGLEIKSEIAVRREVEQYFKDASYIQQRLMNKWDDPLEMLKDMEIEFVEYVIQGNTINPIAVI